MGLGWADWIRFILTPLVLGLIAAIVATRNAKKKPHERLKNLVDIHDKMPEGLDSGKVVEAAIARELVDFDRRVAADQKGFWAGVRERIAQLSGPNEALVASLIAVIAALTVSVAAVVNNDSLEVLPAVIVIFLGAIGGIFGGFSSSRAERKSLALDRVAAYITATFPRAGIQFLASRDVIPSHDLGTGFGEAVTRLKAMGVFTSDGSSTGLRVTPFGKEAIRQSLRRADLQYFANIADVEAEMNARDDRSGREAPGQ